MNQSIQVFIIDEQAISRRRLSRLIQADPEFVVTGEAASVRDGAAQLIAARPDLVVLALDTRSAGGLEALAQIKACAPAARCIALADSDATDDLLQALRMGADGYLLKPRAAEGLCAQLKKAMSGVTVLQESLKEKLVSATRHLKPRSIEKEVTLTERESEILEYLAQGHNNKTIAHALGISLNTVKVHTKNLLVKLRLANRLEAAIWAHKNKQAMSFSAQRG